MNAAEAAVPTDAHLNTDVVIVDAAENTGWMDLRELWRYRDLVWIFAVRDIKVRYRQTVVGIAWTVLQPLGLMFGFNVLKNMLVTEAVPGKVPDQVSTFCGLILYQLFAGILQSATICLVDNRQMVTKVYFPRIALPLSSCLRPLLDFGIGLVVLALLMIWFRVLPSATLIAAPLVVLFTVTTAMAFGLWLSALNAHYRDFGYIVPFLLQVGLFISPAGYEPGNIPGAWRWLYFANPMAALLDSFRWAMLGTPLPSVDSILISALSALAILASGIWYFRRVDRFLADNI